MRAINQHTNDTVDLRVGSGPYVLVTAAYNEETFLEETINSVILQSVLPRVWVIVSDGSTDRTDEIVQRYARRHPFIRLLRRERDENRGFASKVFALRAGVESLTLDAIRFMGHLDADVVLRPSYFRDLLMKFDENPNLGIAGGWIYEKMNGEYRAVPGSSARSIPGAIQMFRRECYQDIGGLLPIEYGGEDWYAEIMGRKCGWQVQSFSELEVQHLRTTGTKGNRVRYYYHEGFTDYSLGAHPIFELFVVARRIPWQPYVLGAMARLVGFLMAHIRGKRMVSSECIAFLRREQKARLRSTLSIPWG